MHLHTCMIHSSYHMRMASISSFAISCIIPTQDIGLQGGQCVSETPSDIDRLRLAGTVQGASSELGNATTTRAAADPVILDDVEGVCDDSSRMNIVSCVEALQCTELKPLSHRVLIRIRSEMNPNRIRIKCFYMDSLIWINMLVETSF